MNYPPMSLLGVCGARKYLTPKERSRFERVAKNADPHTRSLCLVLLWTGARISEVLSLKPSSIDMEEKVITIECLKKRKKGVFRQIPIPDQLILELNKTFKLDKGNEQNNRLWYWSRRTASRRIKKIMVAANIAGLQACSKGIRHSFAIYSIMKGVPLVLLKKWMGHSYLQTTEIYLNFVGAEERSIAERLWA